MAEYKNESWLEPCELAAQEKDPQKLIALIAEIDRLLALKNERPKNKIPGSGIGA
jgi:hypothetical protein